MKPESLYVQHLEYGREPYRELTVELLEKILTETDERRDKRISKAVSWMMKQYFKKPKRKKV